MPTGPKKDHFEPQSPKNLQKYEIETNIADNGLKMGQEPADDRPVRADKRAAEVSDSPEHEIEHHKRSLEATVTRALAEQRRELATTNIIDKLLETLSIVQQIEKAVLSHEDVRKIIKECLEAHSDKNGFKNSRFWFAIVIGLLMAVIALLAAPYLPMPE